jgi:hypothetical protein
MREASDSDAAIGRPIFQKPWISDKRELKKFLIGVGLFSIPMIVFSHYIDIFALLVALIGFSTIILIGIRLLATGKEVLSLRILTRWSKRRKKEVSNSYHKAVRIVADVLDHKGAVYEKDAYYRTTSFDVLEWDLAISLILTARAIGNIIGYELRIGPVTVKNEFVVCDLQKRISEEFVRNGLM